VSVAGNVSEQIGQAILILRGQRVMLDAGPRRFSLHAAVRCGEHQRQDLDRLCRCITRPAFANERLKREGAGDVVLQLKSPWRDGTTHIKMPLLFMRRLAALVPRLRLHLIRFYS